MRQRFLESALRRFVGFVRMFHRLLGVLVAGLMISFFMARGRGAMGVGGLLV
jgi:hypothetical protein